MQKLIQDMIVEWQSIAIHAAKDAAIACAKGHAGYRSNYQVIYNEAMEVVYTLIKLSTLEHKS